MSHGEIGMKACICKRGQAKACICKRGQAKACICKRGQAKACICKRGQAKACICKRGQAKHLLRRGVTNCLAQFANFNSTHNSFFMIITVACNKLVH